MRVGKAGGEPVGGGLPQNGGEVAGGDLLSTGGIRRGTAGSKERVSSHGTGLIDFEEEILGRCVLAVDEVLDIGFGNSPGEPGKVDGIVPPGAEEDVFGKDGDIGVEVIAPDIRIDGAGISRHPAGIEGE